MRIYLDNAATTAISPTVVSAMLPFLTQHYGNPSSIHADGRAARAAIEQARKTVARHLNASVSEIFFTSCGTESNNMALKCAVRDLAVQRIISTRAEHHCVLHSTETLYREGVEVVYLALDEQGHFAIADLKYALQNSDKKTLVSLMYGNNEIGTRHPIAAVGALCAAHDAYFHTDTVQAVGHELLDVQGLGKRKRHPERDVRDRLQSQLGGQVEAYTRCGLLRLSIDRPS